MIVPNGKEKQEHSQGVEGQDLPVSSLPAVHDVALDELGDGLSSIRLCSPEAQQAMQHSLSRFGQLTPVQAFRGDACLEVFDGLKRLRAARDLCWSTLRVEAHELDSAGAKVRLLCCNAGTGLAELEEAWLVRSLYRDDRLTQAQIAIMLSRHKSWVSRRMILAEGLSDELTANVRLGLVSATAAVEIAKLQRCNHDEITRVVTQKGLTTRQTAHLVERLLESPHEQWPQIIKQTPTPMKLDSAEKKSIPRRTPGEQLVADAWAMKALATKLHTRLLERSLQSLGEAACNVAFQELVELSFTLKALTKTINVRLDIHGDQDAFAT